MWKYSRKLLQGKKYSQDDFIPLLVLVIKSFGGIAEKKEVDNKMYELLDSEFSKEIYHQTVANDIPRWQHDVAWAKERAKQHHSYVKSAQEAGRGNWELTKKGDKYADDLIKQLESSMRVIRRKKST